MGKKKGGQPQQTQSKNRRNPGGPFFTPSATIRRLERRMRRVRKSSGKAAADAYARKYIDSLR